MVGSGRSAREERAALVQQVVDGYAVFADHFTVSVDPGLPPGDDYYVQGRVVGPWLHLDAVSNEFLKDGMRLTNEQMTVLENLGWERPRPEEGSVNFSRFLHVPEDQDRAGTEIVRALTEGYGTSLNDAWSLSPPEAVLDGFEPTDRAPAAKPRGRPLRFITPGTTVGSVDALHTLLHLWSGISDAPTIGRTDQRGHGSAVCVVVDLGQDKFSLASDTSREAVLAFLDYVAQAGAGGAWAVVATKTGKARKVVYRDDAELPGWCCYLPEAWERPGTLIPDRAVAARPREIARERVDDDLRRWALTLDREPLSAIMYGSLELFHSNLLAWFFETFPDAADEVFTPGLPDGVQSVRNVGRETKHLDLTMTFPGKERLVVENKVFSIPTIEQLKRYSRDVFEPWEKKGLGLTTGVLQSVYRPDWIDRVGGWTYLGYDELADRIEAALQSETTSYEVETMRRYVRVARALSHLAEAVRVKSLEESVVPGVDLSAVLRDKKLATRLLKFRMHSVADVVRSAVKDLGGTVSAGMGQGGPLLEWFRTLPMLPDGEIGSVGWQLEGSSFRRAIIAPQSLSGRTAALRQQRFELAAANERWFDFTGLDRVLGTVGVAIAPTPKGDAAQGFLRFDPAFVYRYKKTPMITVRQLIQATEALDAELT
jgi:hypothetical protein